MLALAFFWSWFQTIWMPLTMRQVSNEKHNTEYMHLHIPAISVTSSVLDFLGYDGPPIKKLLERAEMSL